MKEKGHIQTWLKGNSLKFGIHGNATRPKRRMALVALVEGWSLGKQRHSVALGARADPSVRGLKAVSALSSCCLAFREDYLYRFIVPPK